MEALNPIFILLNLVVVPAVSYEYLFCHPSSDCSGHPLNRRLKGYYRGLIPRVPWATGYDPTIWIRPVPSNRQNGWRTMTPYQVRPHHSWLERRDHPSKRHQV
jgi:hypothetical protein